MVGTDATELTSFSSAIDILRSVTGGRETIALDVLACVPGSTITIVTAEKGVARTLSVKQGDTIELQVRHINSVAGVARLRVRW